MMMNAKGFHTAVVATALLCGLPGRSQGGSLDPLGKPGAPRVALASVGPPISFQENLGQADSRVRYLWRGKGSTLFLGGEGATLVLHPAGGSAGAALHLSLVGTEPAACAEGLDRLPGRVSYLRGSDPSHWVRSAPTYARVRYAEVYPGIDLVFHGGEGSLEYDFVVRPGADPAAIRLRFDGAEATRLDASGRLVLSAGAGEIVQQAPVAYQLADAGRVPVASRAVLADDDEIGFELGDYDRTRELVIDPVLAFSTFLGGSGGDDIRDVAVDASGYVYVLGWTDSVNLPTTTGALQETFQGVYVDAFVTKLDPSGSTLVYSTYLGDGTDNNEDARDIAVDASGNAYIGGHTRSAAFPTTPGAYDTTHNGDYDGFVAKLDPSGSALVYSTFLGGAATDRIYALVVDPTQDVYVVGSTSSTDFPTTAGAFDRSHNGDLDAFVTKLNPSGSALVYSTYLGGSRPKNGKGSGDDVANDVALDASGNAYVAGYTKSAQFPLKTPYDGTFTGTMDGFVSKLNPGGSALVYSTFLGGNETIQGEFAAAIAVDASGAAVVSGMTSASDFPTTAGAYDRSWNNGRDLFVTKFNAAGSGLAFSTFLGGGDDEGYNGQDLALDGTGAVYVASSSESADFPTTPGALDSTHDGVSDAVIAKLNATGSALLYGTYVGGGLEDWGHRCALRGSSLHVAGSTNSQDYPVTPGAFQGTFQGGGDGFVLRLDF